MDGANPSIVGAKALGIHLMTLTILEPWRSPPPLPLMRFDCPGRSGAFFNAMNLKKESSCESEPLRLYFHARP